MRPLSLAAIFSALLSAAAGAATVLAGLAASGPAPDMARVLLGSADTLAPVYLSFSFLGLAWLLAALGLKRAEAAAA